MVCRTGEGKTKFTAYCKIFWPCSIITKQGWRAGYPPPDCAAADLYPQDEKYVFVEDIKDENMQILALMRHPERFNKTLAQSSALKWLMVSTNPRLIERISIPSFEMQITAALLNPTTVDLVPLPSTSLQKIASGFANGEVEEEPFQLPIIQSWESGRQSKCYGYLVSDLRNDLKSNSEAFYIKILYHSNFMSIKFGGWISSALLSG